MIARALLIAGVLAFGTSAHGAEAPSAPALIDRAIAAHGGRAALSKWPDLEMKGTTESFGGRSAGRRTDVVLRERADGAYRRETSVEMRGRKIRPVELCDGTTCKRRFTQAWDDLPLDEPRERAAHRLPFLLAAASRDPRVEGEAVEADVPSWLVSVADGRDRATLALAKDDGHVVAIDYPGTSAEGMGTKKDVRRKLVFRDLREVGDLRLPFDVEIAEDGTPDARLRWDSIEELEAFDPAWLRVPDASRRFVPGEELSF